MIKNKSLRPLFSDPFSRVVVATAKAIQVACRSNGKACSELIKCLKNPNRCKDKFCKRKPNKTYHGDDGKSGVCEVPGCKSEDSTATAQFKLAAAMSCVALREFVAITCHGGKYDPQHKRELDEAKEKIKNCKNRCWN